MFGLIGITAIVYAVVLVLVDQNWRDTHGPTRWSFNPQDIVMPYIRNHQGVRYKMFDKIWTPLVRYKRVRHTIPGRVIDE
jgi:hypothetical protein